MSSRSRSNNIGRNQNRASDSSPRWWRWRRRSSVGFPVATTAPANVDESWSQKLDRICQQVAPFLPPLSAATRKAIICMVALVVVWKFVIWTLELVVTGACFALAVSILLCFVRPDIALWLITQVLPPYVDEARSWLSHSFMRASQLLDRGPPGTSSLPLPAPPPSPHPTPRSPRTTVIRVLPSEAALAAPANA